MALGGLVGVMKRVMGGKSASSGETKRKPDNLSDPLGQDSLTQKSKQASPAKTRGEDMTVQEAYDSHKDAFWQFSKRAGADESVEFLRSVDEGRDPKTMYNRFIKEGGSRQVNLPNGVREVLDALAAKGQYSRMNFADARASIWGMVKGDLQFRMQTDPDFCAAVDG